MKTSTALESSFRDPSGFLFRRGGTLYRQVNTSYREHYDHLVGSGLLAELTRAGLLISHEEVHVEAELPDRAYKLLRPEPVEFISYPYEWSFSQLKDAALTTLQIQKAAMQCGMTLKDCSAYNIQFHNGRPVLIDTLSFERYREGQVWVPYRQFCQHFLSPLALMALTDIRLSQLLRVYIDGIPLDLASALLPGRTRLSPALLSHIHLHAKSQEHYASRAVDTSVRKMPRLAFLGLTDNLESAVRGLKWAPHGNWADYYRETNYSEAGLQHKRRLVDEFLRQVNPRTVWDLGANTGLFSRVAGALGAQTVSFDSDPACTEANYLQCVQEHETRVLPLWLDLTNPSPGIGWQNRERMSLLERGPADAALALAVVHHLAISNNVPFDHLADFFARACRALVIEFVPKSDSQVQKLLASREDVFADYAQPAFEAVFGTRFAIQKAIQIEGSERTLYLMTRTATA